MLEFDSLSNKIIKCAITVHKALGPGLFEQVYKVCLHHELQKSGLNVLAEVGIPVMYDGVCLDLGYRIDLLVNDSIIIELKAVEQLSTVHKSQLLTHLRFANKHVGLLLNFNSTLLRERGIVRVVNSYSPFTPPA